MVKNFASPTLNLDFAFSKDRLGYQYIRDALTSLIYLQKTWKPEKFKHLGNTTEKTLEVTTLSFTEK
jgi:hypothetical protein